MFTNCGQLCCGLRSNRFCCSLAEMFRETRPSKSARPEPARSASPLEPRAMFHMPGKDRDISLSIYSRSGYITVMSEVAFWILTALAGGRRHGYAILLDVEQLTAAAVSLRVTTLYATLERLERDGYVRRAGEETVDGRARRYYELTDDGSEALAMEAERLAARLRAVESRLAARPAHSRPAPATMSWGFAQ